jgi:tetratricopeptide (TPR) repeat protein
VADSCLRAATLAHESGNEQAAIAAWKKCVELDPGNREANYGLMRALARTSPEEAKIYRERLDHIQSTHDTLDRAQTLNNFALAAEKQKKWDEAIGNLRQAIEICGTCQAAPILRKNLGLIECEAGRVSDGKRDLLIAQKALPEDTDIQRALELAGKAQK